jgi:Na+-transporting methylmalonyl-CoA/oxaloacetate decarboxylase gamma subunit
VFFCHGVADVFLSLFVLLAALAFALPAAAQDKNADEPAALNTEEKVEIVTDQESGEVRIVIDGQPVVTIHAQGLHVTGDIEYTGLLRDTGGDAQ